MEIYILTDEFDILRPFSTPQKAFAAAIKDAEDHKDSFPNGKQFQECREDGIFVRWELEIESTTYWVYRTTLDE